MTGVNELSARRVDKAECNSDYAPLDLLRSMIVDIEKGALSPTSLLIIHIKETPDTTEYGVYKCNLDVLKEVGLYEMAKDQTIRRWRGE